jgi:hypothetical protein
MLQNSKRTEYDRSLAVAVLTDAAEQKNAGRLPAHWEERRLAPAFLCG